ncbi:MAG: hypothetical protein OEL89_02555 [Candidatus Peregrinibacteria bacterium]|nr:hypothetical protein [Candidatus Peregrinibacteria bacterium]
MSKQEFTRKEQKILDKNFKILDKCVGISEDLTQEASERIKKIMGAKTKKVIGRRSDEVFYI